MRRKLYVLDSGLSPTASPLFSHINDNNISRLELPLENLYRINESSIMDDSSKDMNIDEEAFQQIDVEFTNISVISEEMKKG